jgi:hypothetical protein
MCVSGSCAAKKTTKLKHRSTRSQHISNSIAFLFNADVSIFSISHSSLYLSTKVRNKIGALYDDFVKISGIKNIQYM